MSAFGSRSRTDIEPDLLGRPRRRLAIEWAGLDSRVTAPCSFDVDDLDLLARDTASPDWERILDTWTPASARQLLPWAVVHRAVRAPFVQHWHADAMCAVAGAPDGASTCEALFGPEIAWLAYGAPGPELAAALAAACGGASAGAALAPHLGLFAWGETDEDVTQRWHRFEAVATAWMEREVDRGAGVAQDPPTEIDVERTLSALRGRASASASGPVVLSVDPSLVGVAYRGDLARIVDEAARSEMTWPWPATAALIAGGDGGPGDGEPGDGAASVHLVPGIGLVSAGTDEAEAITLGIVASHAHRVAAFRVDASRGRSPRGEAEPPTPAWAPTQLAALPSMPGGPLRGRVYIVTGAASGIGRDVARHLAEVGASLALGDRDAEALELVADELEPVAGRPVTVGGDLTDEAVVDRLVDATVRRYGGVDGAVLNAGIALPGKVRDLSAADWRRSLDVNATSHFLLVKRLLPVLEWQGLGGSLVFIGSKNMFSPGAGFGAYSASKAALAQLARVVAIEAGPIGVRSNIVNPDNVFEGSALWSPELRAQRAAVYGIKPEDLEAYYTQRNLMKVPITGEDVAKGVAFLLSDEASRTTCCVLTVDGGVPGVFPR
jgi:NAD(P)-dependent dehydrogenase (short-subunit alcohol dehydrogenase family)